MSQKNKQDLTRTRFSVVMKVIKVAKYFQGLEFSEEDCDLNTSLLDLPKAGHDVVEVEFRKYPSGEKYKYWVDVLIEDGKVAIKKIRFYKEDGEHIQVDFPFFMVGGESFLLNELVDDIQREMILGFLQTWELLPEDLMVGETRRVKFESNMSCLGGKNYILSNWKNIEKVEVYLPSWGRMTFYLNIISPVRLFGIRYYDLHGKDVVFTSISDGDWDMEVVHVD